MTALPSQSATVRLIEFTSVADARVDRAQAMIRDVRVLGLESSNKNVYAAAAIAKAIPLYEQAMVHLNHPPRGREQEVRRYEERIGRLVNVRVDAGGLRGDLSINPKHPHAEQLFWDAEHSPASVGLSHNAEGAGRYKGERFVVEEILSVRSVDLVTDPATARSLFESHTTSVQNGDVRCGSDLEAEVAQLREELAAYRRQEASAERRRAIVQQMEAAGIPRSEASDLFIDLVAREDDRERARMLIEDRARLLRSTGRSGPTSRAASDIQGGLPTTAGEFAAVVMGRSSAMSGGQDSHSDPEFSAFVEAVTVPQRRV